MHGLRYTCRAPGSALRAIHRLPAKNPKEVVKQHIRCFAFAAPGQMARIVFNTLANAHFFKHFQIVDRAGAQTLGFKRLAQTFEFGSAQIQLTSGQINRAFEAFGRTAKCVAG